MAEMELSEALEILDAKLLAGVAGQEAELAGWLDERRELLERLLESGRSPSCLPAIGARTQSLQEKFLHWRRSAIMELSAIDQHARFLNEQRPDGGSPGQSRIDVQG